MKSESDTPRLGVIGDIVEDIVVLPSAPFAAGSDTPSRIVRRRGGSAANVAVAAAQLVGTRFIGCIGDDPAGRQLVRWLDDEAPGIDYRLQASSDTPTGAIMVLVDDTGERHMFPDRGANRCLADLDDVWLDGLRVVHVTAYSLDGGDTAITVTKTLAHLSGLGCLISFDASSQALIEQFGVAEFAALVDRIGPSIVFANAAEAALLGWDVPHTSLNRVVVVKHGGEPVLIRTMLGAWNVPVERLSVKDTTGAGDAFAAGVLASIVSEGLDRHSLLMMEQWRATDLIEAGQAQANWWLRRPSAHNNGR